jgi:hypothetical protein
VLENSPASQTEMSVKSASGQSSIGGEIGRVDGRSAVARRAKLRTAAFVAALGGPDVVDDILLAKVQRAAELSVLAERARIAALQGEAVALDDVVRVERLAELAVRRLGIDKQQREPARVPLRERLAEEAGT